MHTTFRRKNTESEGLAKHFSEARENKKASLAKRKGQEYWLKRGTPHRRLETTLLGIQRSTLV